MATLYEKVYGCLAASRIGSSMGAAVEGWSPERITETYGYLEELRPYTHYRERGITWERQPGTTEDGIERQKLMCQAIMDKQDRITAQDLYEVARRVTELDKMWYMTQPEDLRVIEFMKAGVPAPEVGRLSGWHGLNFARACQPIGLINACDPDGAIRDVLDIGRLFFPPTDSALIWAGVYVAAIAAALAEDATVASVLAAAKKAGDERMAAEIDRAIEIAERHRAYGGRRAMRAEFYEYYSGQGIPYAACYANETVCKGLAVFAYTQGDAQGAITFGVNFGRDTDCLAATAGGLAGAFSGIGAVPDRWVEQVDAATHSNPYTNIDCTIAEHAQGLYDALQARSAKIRLLADQLDRP